MFDEKIKGNLGFGCMRLAMNEGEVDKEEFCRMIDAFIGAGFNYFDTAHGYIDGKSERAIGECLSASAFRQDTRERILSLQTRYLNGILKRRATSFLTSMLSLRSARWIILTFISFTR